MTTNGPMPVRLDLCFDLFHGTSFLRCSALGLFGIVFVCDSLGPCPIFSILVSHLDVQVSHLPIRVPVIKLRLLDICGILPELRVMAKRSDAFFLISVE